MLTSPTDLSLMSVVLTVRGATVFYYNSKSYSQFVGAFRGRCNEAGAQHFND
jgi:hypothetical protein